MAGTENIKLKVNGTELSFSITIDLFNDYQGQCIGNPTATPDHSQNFLMRTVSNDTKKQLQTLLQTQPGAAVEIAGAVIEQYKKPLDIQLGN